MITLANSKEPRVDYPESDGEPMAENTIQFRWITTIQGNLDLLFRDRPDVFVAGDNFWYPVEGKPNICLSPDVYVVFGRPKGDRGSYKQWAEGGIPLSVVFEVMSPSNTFSVMQQKFAFYERYGVQEYYIIDPQGERTTLDVFVREGNELKVRPAEIGASWVSPLMKVRFIVTHDTVELYYPDGRQFETFMEIGEVREAERQRAEAEHQRAEAERQRAEAERQRADVERERAAKLAARLRELGVNPDDL